MGTIYEGPSVVVHTTRRSVCCLTNSQQTSSNRRVLVQELDALSAAMSSF